MVAKISDILVQVVILDVSAYMRKFIIKDTLRKIQVKILKSNTLMQNIGVFWYWINTYTQLI